MSGVTLHLILSGVLDLGIFVFLPFFLMCGFGVRVRRGRPCWDFSELGRCGGFWCFFIWVLPRVCERLIWENLWPFLDVAEMVEAMKSVAKLDVELTVEERNLLSVGYKNVIGARRASWRILSSIEQKEDSKGNEHNVRKIKEYRQKVEAELSNICGDVMKVIDEHLIPSCAGGESTVFFYKM